MTVRELLARLNELTLDARVTVLDYDGHLVDVHEVEQIASDNARDDAAGRVNVAIMHDWRVR